MSFVYALLCDERIHQNGQKSGTQLQRNNKST